MELPQEGVTYLNCFWNGLTDLDISHNSDLTYLDCSINQLTSLNLANNTDLHSLH